MGRSAGHRCRLSRICVPPRPDIFAIYLVNRTPDDQELTDERDPTSTDRTRLAWAAEHNGQSVRAAQASVSPVPLHRLGH
jgi:hypothetical protein